MVQEWCCRGISQRIAAGKQLVGFLRRHLVICLRETTIAIRGYIGRRCWLMDTATVASVTASRLLTDGVTQSVVPQSTTTTATTTTTAIATSSRSSSNSGGNIWRGSSEQCVQRAVSGGASSPLSYCCCRGRQKRRQAVRRRMTEAYRGSAELGATGTLLLL